MANYTGATGLLQHGSLTSDVTNWKLNTAKPVENQSDSGSGTSEEWGSVGRKGWSGSFDAFVKSGEDVVDEGDSATLTLTLNTGKAFSGTAIIESVDYNDPTGTGESVTYTANFRGTGALTKPTF